MKSAFICALTLISLMLTACGSNNTDGVQEDVAYAEPGWMAEVRAQEEEYGRAGAACIRAQGLEPSADDEFSITYKGVPDNPAPPEIDAAHDAALETCSEQIPPPAYTANSPEAEYDRILDLRACLIDQGYEIPEAPSLDVWTEDFRTSMPWDPYFVFDPVPDPPLFSVPPEEITRLQAVCTPSMIGTRLQFFVA